MAANLHTFNSTLRYSLSKWLMFMARHQARQLCGADFVSLIRAANLQQTAFSAGLKF